MPQQATAKRLPEPPSLDRRYALQVDAASELRIVAPRKPAIGAAVESRSDIGADSASIGAVVAQLQQTLELLQRLIETVRQAGTVAVPLSGTRAPCGARDCTPPIVAPIGPQRLFHADLTFDSVTRRVERSGREVHLRPTEFRLLKILLLNPHQAFSRADLIRAAWPPRINVEMRTVDVHVARLRQALTAAGEPDLIRTIHAYGYALRLPEASFQHRNEIDLIGRDITATEPGAS